MKLYKKFAKVIVAVFVAMLVCGTSMYTVHAADKNSQEEDYGISPCYSYTSSIITGLSISDGDAICTTSVTGFYSTTTKITITQTLQRKSGSSWVDVWSWTNTKNYWNYDYVNYYYPLTKGATYRVKSCSKVYSGSSYETIYSYSGERTY